MKSRQKTISKIKAGLGDLSIAKKIGYGYALAIGIAILGTSIGMIVSEYYQKKAQQRLQLANTQEHLFYRLQNHVLELRSHPQELVAVLDDSIWFQYETSQFKNELKKTRELLSELISFTNSYPADLLAKKPTRIKNILEDYQKTIDLYSDLVESLWQEIDSLNLKPEEIPRARQQVLTAMAGEDAIKIRTDFEKLSDSLTRISITAEIQQRTGAPV